jgi:hypothetical protein
MCADGYLAVRSNAGQVYLYETLRDTKNTSVFFNIYWQQLKHWKHLK